MTGQSDALAWASQLEPFDRWDAISATPWSQVYRLSGGRKVAFLKVLPSGKNGEISILEAFTDSSLGSTPRVLAHNRGLGLVLMEDHGGMVKRRAGFKDLNKAIHAYVDIQIESIALQPRMADLPCIISNEMGSLADALFGGQGHSLITHFLSRREGFVVSRKLAVSEKSIRSMFAEVGNLPLILEHGDLHPGNLAIRPDGSVVIFDWADALWAPAGFSIPFLLGGANAAIRQLRHRRPNLCQAYQYALADRGYATRSELGHGLRASMTAGVLRALLAFMDLEDVDDSARLFIGDQVRAGLYDLLNVVHTRGPLPQGGIANDLNLRLRR